MATLKQIEANRRNALKSTGPTSLEGKERSRTNAWRHGLTAETVIVSVEDADDYEAFQAAIIVDYNAQTAVERELVLRLASVLWRLRRATAIETSIFQIVADADPGAGTGSEFRNPNSRYTSPAGHTLEHRFLRLMELPSSALDRLSRYEHILWRQARQLILTLRPSSRRSKRERSFRPYLRRSYDEPPSDDFE